MRPTMGDWNAHLTTLFPEFRMKGFIEARAIDGQGPELALVAPAIIKGIFYDADALAAAWALVDSWSLDERATLLADVHRRGLDAEIAGRSLLELSRALLEIATTGLERAAVPGPTSASEACYLAPLAELLAQGQCPADVLLAQWAGAWSRDIGRLVEGVAYRSFPGG
jgi:glutamate--cysteine ligase